MEAKVLRSRNILKNKTLQATIRDKFCQLQAVRATQVDPFQWTRLDSTAYSHVINYFLFERPPRLIRGNLYRTYYLALSRSTYRHTIYKPSSEGLARFVGLFWKKCLRNPSRLLAGGFVPKMLLMNLCSDITDLQVSNRYQVDDDDAAIRTIQLDRMVNVADVALEAVSDRKEVAAEKAFEPDEQQKWRHLFFSRLQLSRL